MQNEDWTEDLTGVEWRDTNWIERFGGFQNRQMVLDYFAMSPFWDRQCNNQILSMQTQYNTLGQSDETIDEKLSKMTGIEYAVIREQPPVWVILKRKRRGPGDHDVLPIATYYIAGANVYQSPTVYSVIANRLLTSVFHVNSAFHEAQKLADFHPAKGYSWSNGDAATEEHTGSTPESTQPQPLAQPSHGVFQTRAGIDFGNRMRHAIEISAERVASMRQGVDAEGRASKGDDTVMTSLQRGKHKTWIKEHTSLNHLHIEDAHAKRSRKKVEDTSNAPGKRKKKAGKYP